MSGRIIMVLITLLVISFGVQDNLFAKRRGAGKNQRKFERIDKNRDGVISKKEMRKEKSNLKRYRKSNQNWWQKRADTNNDGQVSAEEKATWKQLTKERIDMNEDGVISPKERRLSWRHAKSKVNTKLELQYDTNKDGWLEPDEIKNYLNARQKLVKSKGKARVDSKIEKEYDINNDDLIDESEAQVMKEDIQ